MSSNLLRKPPETHGKVHNMHVHRKLVGSRIVALTDINLAATEVFNASAQLGAKFYAGYADPINAPDVDALLVASWGEALAGAGCLSELPDCQAGPARPISAALNQSVN